MSVTSSVLSGGAERSGSTRYLPIAAPRIAVLAVATITTAASWSHAESMPSARTPMNVASPAKAPTMSTSPWENLITSSTPKNSVNPTATMAYITPSIRPLATYWPRTPGSIQRPLQVKPSASEGSLTVRCANGDPSAFGLGMSPYYLSCLLPVAYSLSSHTTHLPSCTTYFVMSGTMFCPWSSKVILPMIESLSLVLFSSAVTPLRLGPTFSITSMTRFAAVKANGP